MKILADLVSKSEQKKQLVALESGINDMLDFVETLRPMAGPSGNMSLESVMGHLRPSQAERFSLANIAQEDSDTGFLIALGLAIAAALVVAIGKFLKWMFPSIAGSSSSTSSSGTNYASSSPSGKSEILIKTETRNAEVTRSWDAVDSRMRKANSLQMPKANASRDGTAKPQQTHIRDVDDVVAEWLKTEGARNSRAGQFMLETPPEYHNIGSKGVWYSSVKAVKAVIRKMGEGLDGRAKQLQYINTVLVDMNKGSLDEQKACDIISGYFEHPLSVDVDAHSMTYGGAYTYLQSSYAEAEQPNQHVPLRFTKMMHYMVPPGLLKHAAEIAESVEVANSGMEKVQPHLETIEDHMKYLAGKPGSSGLAVLEVVKKALEVLRQDIFGYVRTTHQLMAFVDKVHKLNNDLIATQTIVIDVIKASVRDDEGKKPEGLEVAIEALKKAIAEAH